MELYHSPKDRVNAPSGSVRMRGAKRTAGDAGAPPAVVHLRVGNRYRGRISLARITGYTAPPAPALQDTTPVTITV